MTNSFGGGDSATEAIVFIDDQFDPDANHNGIEDLEEVKTALRKNLVDYLNAQLKVSRAQIDARLTAYKADIDAFIRANYMTEDQVLADFKTNGVQVGNWLLKDTTPGGKFKF